MRGPHNRIRHLLLVVASLLVPTGAARAQDINERVRLAVEVTDQRIEQADMVVTSADNERAAELVVQARAIQVRAKTELAAGHPRVAMDLTLRAREVADRAIAMVKGLPDPDRVVAQLERTRELLEAARDRIEGCNDDRARAMLRAAFEMQARAEVAARESRYLAALQLTVSARERGQRAMRICNVHENLEETAERALRRTDEIIARAEDRVAESPSERARGALARAVELQGRATLEFRGGRFEASLRLTQSARTFAYTALRLSGERDGGRDRGRR